MFWRKIKVFWWNHWVKLAIIFWLLFIFWLPAQSLSSLDKYQRDFMLASLSTMGLQSTVFAVVYVVLMMWMMQGGMQKLKKGQIKSDAVNIHWKDVIGMDAAKAESKEIVELIKDRARIKKIGGNIIRGMLMMGPPGCGKTYLAKAMATEAGVPFISMSGSEFVEMYVGVGASRVRQLFNKARRLAYAEGGCVIFIDEIDAIGHKRVHDMGFGGTQERNTTLNQLLVEMDGLGVKQENVVIIGATNAAEKVMDEALLRPGRFDRKIFVTKPSMTEREDLFRFYLSKVKCEDNIDFGKVARKAVGSSPADIANLTKEAALIAIRNKEEKINERHLSEAMERIYLGLKSNIKMNAKEKMMTAYHETGHLIALYLLHPTDDVFKATIIPRGGALGLVSHLPPDDKYSVDRNEIIANIKILLAGYIAEKIKFNTTTSGVSNDFEKAMWHAHRMVWDLGMGKSNWVGNYSTIPADQLSEDIKQKLNLETQEIIQDCMVEVEALIRKENVIFERFAQELIKKEELDYDDIEAIFKEYGKANPRIHSQYTPKT